jgi:hypothetical protein
MIFQKEIDAFEKSVLESKTNIASAISSISQEKQIFMDF